jgi:hypothetical protein
MKLIPRVSAAGLTAVVVAGALLTSAGAAHATTAPPWEPDGNSVGGLLFFDSSGHSLTGGNINDPIAGFIEGTKTIRSGDTKATLYGYLPKDGVAPGGWNGEALAGPSPYPNAAAPSAISQTLPLVTGNPGVDFTIADLVADFPNTDVSSDGYAGLYQLRLVTSASGLTATSKYDSADILITGSGASATWSVAYSKTQVTTKTTLTASPSTSAFHGATVKLSASVSPANAAGSIKFLNGTKLLKTVKVSGGKASFSTKTLPTGTLKLRATFTPTNTTAFTSSTSAAHTMTIKAHATKVSLKASSTSIKVGKKLTLTVKESPAVAGKVVIYDGAKKLATVTVKKGKATYSTSKLKAGTHSLKAKFTPTNTQSYKVSTSKVVKVKVTK